MHRAEVLEEVLEQAPFGFVLLDGDLRYVLVNEALAAINGVPVDEHAGRRFDVVVPELAATVGPLLRRVLETREAIPSVHVEGETAAIPGVRRRWSLRVFPVPGGVAALVAEIPPPDRGAAIVLREVLQPGALPEVPGLQLALRRHSADPMLPGGDFCDVFPVAPGRWGLVLGDTHRVGVIAAAGMATLREAVRTALVLDPDPVAALHAADRALAARPDVHEPLTALVAVVEPRGGGTRVRAAAVGQPLPLVCTAKGHTRAHPAPRGRLGRVGGALRPGVEEEILGPGDTLLVHSGGLTAAGAAGTPLAPEDLAWVLADTRSSDLVHAADQFERLMRRRARPGGDDATVLLLRSAPRAAGWSAGPD